MRAMKLLLLLGLILAVSGTAEAVSVPGVPGGPLRIYTRDRDQGTGYAGAAGTYTRATPEDVFVGLTAYAPAGVMPIPGHTVNEDTWGVFNFYQLSPGAVNPVGNDIVDAPGPMYYEWTGGDAMTGDTALVGVFWGGWDSKVTIGTANQLEVFVQDVYFELWAVDKTNVDLTYHKSGPAYDNPLDRQAVNRYDDWVDTADGTRQLLLSGTSTEFRFTGTQNLGTGTFDGDTLTYWDIDQTVGAWGQDWTSPIPFFIDDFGNRADLKLTFNIDTGSNGWSVNSNDDGGAIVVPEPLTCMGLILSAFGVGGYLRRRGRERLA